MNGDDLIVPPIPVKVADAMLAAFDAGVAQEKAKHGWWWQRRRLRAEAQRVHWAAFGWLGPAMQPGPDPPD